MEEHAPDYPFRYSFLNQDWEICNKAEGQRGKIFNALAALSIFISCLGLFALCLLRRKEDERNWESEKYWVLPGPDWWGYWEKVCSFGVDSGTDRLSYRLVHHERMAFKLCFFISKLAGIQFADGSSCLYGNFIDYGAYHSLKVSAANPAHSLRYE